MNKTLIITGGSRGIGEKTISHFLKNNWNVINISRTPCHIPTVKNFNIDLSSVNDIQKHTQQLQTAVNSNSLICLVHNAAFYQRDNTKSVSAELLQKTLQVNVISPATLNTIFIPHMQPGSSIIYIGSTLAEKAVPESLSYVVSKHAIKALMKTTCQDLAGTSIHTCCINPGLVNTTMLKETMSDEIKTHLLENVVLGKRLIEPEEIAEIIYFCANTATLNGATINADLGQREA